MQKHYVQASPSLSITPKSMTYRETAYLKIYEEKEDSDVANIRYTNNFRNWHEIPIQGKCTVLKIQILVARAGFFTIASINTLSFNTFWKILQTKVILRINHRSLAFVKSESSSATSSSYYAREPKPFKETLLPISFLNSLPFILKRICYL